MIFFEYVNEIQSSSKNLEENGFCLMLCDVGKIGKTTLVFRKISLCIPICVF